MSDTIVTRIIGDAALAGRTALSEIEAKRIVGAIGINVAIPQPAATADDAAAAAAGLGFPVVLKVLSPDVSHKSEVGGVELGLGSEVEVRAAFARIERSLAAKAPGAKFEGVAVQPMAAAGGVELLAGIVRDDRYGATIMVGLGGILVEILKDTAVRLAPVTESEALAMLAELRGAELLRGVRGRAAVDIGAVAATLVKLSEFAAAHPEVREMDLNPIVAYSSGVAVLDARVLLGAAGAKSAAADPNRAARLENLKRAFNPRSVVVIGDKKAGGYLWLRAMANLKTKLYSIQIDPNEVAGIEALGVENHKSLAEIKEPIDYAVSAVPRQVAPRILRDCVANQVGSIGFFTSGFSETGEELGIRLEAELREIALGSEIALVGPNCMGLANPSIGMRNYPEGKVGEPGDVCFISQSGTHTINFCVQAPARGIRVNKAASIGNVLVLEAADYIDLMAADPATRVIGMYIEGVRDGRRFFESLRAAAARHPIVVWKGGTTEAGARATFSHTGSLATPKALWSAMVRQAGAVEVASLDAMLDAVELLARGRTVAGRAMGLVAMTGGQSVVITDTFAAGGLEIPALSQASYDELATFFNVIGGSYRNPLDAGGTIGSGVHPGGLDRILAILERDPAIDSIVLEVGTGFRAARWATHEDEIIALLDKLAEFGAQSSKPFALILHPAHVEATVARAKELARARGLIVFDSFERAAAAFATAAAYWERRAANGQK
ncbi:MAG TPA: acetate--CoA ligase family protein [Candidatus Binataceae bacterium]|nr:acetate--CoA ligase family protein [Candidatus Binataceae bacterium]